MHYNFCRIHQYAPRYPAGVSDHGSEIEEVIALPLRA
jgi:hypothetical protein